MRATDVYKFLYQGIFGVGHILNEGAKRRLEEEAGVVNKNEYPNEPLFESVSADGSIVRVNLRPFKRRCLSIDKLYDAMKETGKVQDSPENFLLAWSVFSELASSGAIEIDDKELSLLNNELKEKGPLPHHHSESYRNTYYPAYRVVKKKTLEKIIGL